MDLNGEYEERPFPKFRQVIVDVGELGKKVNTMKGLIELDVTKGRETIRDFKKKGKQLSFTAWIMKCIGQAVSEHKEVHAIRKGKKKVIIFKDVDISVQVERVVRGQHRPVPFVVRKVNEKSVKEITDEIRSAQSEAAAEDTTVVKGEPGWAKWLPSLPKFLRMYFWRKARDPFSLKRVGGTVGITSVGMFGRFGGWPIPESPGFYPLLVALGGITRKPGVLRDKIKIREYLSMTVLIDHDVVDGAPAARFVSRLAELVENGYGLTEE
jgi:pyruvate/2-oxoglutarate dehydrogenase complex dihydrolipoamide acyltransferase (E2) component